MVYGLSPQAVRKAFSILSSARLHSYIRPCRGQCPGHSVVRAAGAKRSSDPEDHDCYRPCSAAGLACSDSFASHHNHWKSHTFLITPPSGGPCTLPVAAETSLVTPDRPADPHQFVRQRHGSFVMANALGCLQRPALQLGQSLRCS